MSVNIVQYSCEDIATDEKILAKYSASLNQEPVIFCDLSDIVWKWHFWQRHLPRVTPFYAVKCNYDPLVLATLAKLGAGFDCASKAEVEMVRMFHVDPSRIIYAQPVKFVPHLRFAEANHVSLMTFDRASELDKVRRFFPAARLVIRIRYDAKDVLFKMGNKFGCEPVGEAQDLLRLAKSMDLNVVGVSFHVGTGCNDIETYRDALWACKVLMEFGKEVLGFQMSIVDIGGGFHGTRENNFKDIAEIINGALEEFFPEEREKEKVKIIAEPGQFFTTSAFSMFVTVQARRHLEGGECMEYIVNDSVYNTFRSCPEILQFLKIEAVRKSSADETRRSIILGCCPEENDFITGEAQLPVLKVGDLILARNIGSYSLSMQSEYGRCEHAKVKYFVRVEDAGVVLG